MRLFEHEGKDLFESVGIELLPRQLVASVEELEAISFEYPVVVKSQVLSGKRGKRGLIKICNTQAEAGGILSLCWVKKSMAKRYQVF